MTTGNNQLKPRHRSDSCFYYVATLSGFVTRRMLLLILLIPLALEPLRVHAQNLNSLPDYESSEPISGVIRVWGDSAMDTLMKYWQAGFSKHHPGVSFETKLLGTGTGMAGIYTDVADLAVMGREATASEIMAFGWVFKYKPSRVEVTTGSLSVPGKTFAVTVLVHNTNPLSKLTLAQLDAIFGSEHQRGLSNIRTWGDLGLTGEWQNKPIHVYGYDTETGTGTFFKKAVFAGSDKWNCEIKEFADLKLGNSLRDAGQRVLNALARDRYGIAYGNLGRNARVKPLAVASADGEPFYEATKANLIERKYPLTRATFIYVNRAPGKQIDAKVQEFLRYILSQEGQREVVREGVFLPLSEKTVREQLKRLE